MEDLAGNRRQAHFSAASLVSENWKDSIELRAVGNQRHIVTLMHYVTSEKLIAESTSDTKY